jgi:glutamate 5-kinase
MGKRIVIKVGSSTLTDSRQRLDLNSMRNLCSQVAELRKIGHQVVLVTSGAIVCGSEQLHRVGKLKTINEKQAAASVGQVLLMKEYNHFMGQVGYSVGQILLTNEDFVSQRSINAKQTLDTLLKMGVVPIINENDSIATQEIKVGDNDQLSAHVANLIDAHLLIILTDTEGLHESNPQKNPTAPVIRLVKKVTPDILKIATHETSKVGTGGFGTKLAAVKILSKKKIQVVIANGRRENVMRDIVAGKVVGTRFLNR